MMYTGARMFAQFGTGTVSVGAGKLKDSEQWFVSIKELNKPHKVGETIVKEDQLSDNEMLLTFPSENQMLKVMAAFTNRSFEQMINKWNAAKDLNKWATEAIHKLQGTAE